ncbi:hypothetical protein [Salinibacter ruber]|uniref:hypothetical protein n=1 Tax=Salinibacter ruber TaxID=146919 RepID=UPI0021686E28|nr:hypothetical protein [Salinibacter ruber]MCS4119359.1 hypothetical protein [Salinibacter ruber]MCS4142617.1 hypothetical protein [Salinibacter ruber]
MRGAFLLATLVLAVPADAQPTLLGQDRETVEERVEMPQDEMEVKKVVDKPSTVCYDMPLLNQRECYSFVSGICRSQSKHQRKETRKDVLKNYIETKRKWGEPVAYAADFTEVNSFEQARKLADPLAIVAFPPNENGVAMYWQWVVRPDEEEGLTGGRYTYVRKYVDLTYVEELGGIMNYWDER